MKHALVLWVFFFIFIATGVLNVVLVHPVPGLFYLILALIYLPHFDSLLMQRAGVRVPLMAKVVVAIVVLWGTLAVGDLAEILGL